MDILTFIDKFNQNFDKQPEPRYNTQKYFTGGRVGFENGKKVKFPQNQFTKKFNKSLKDPEYIKKLVTKINLPEYANMSFKDLFREKVITNREMRELQKLGYKAQRQGKKFNDALAKARADKRLELDPNRLKEKAKKIAGRNKTTVIHHGYQKELGEDLTKLIVDKTGKTLFSEAEGVLQNLDVEKQKLLNNPTKNKKRINEIQAIEDRLKKGKTIPEVTSISTRTNKPVTKTNVSLKPEQKGLYGYENVSIDKKGNLTKKLKGVDTSKTIAGLSKDPLNKIDFRNVSPKNKQKIISRIAEQLKNAGFRCGAAKGLTCDNPEAYFKDINEKTKIAQGTGKAASKAAKAISFAKNILGPAAIAGEIAIEGLIIGNDMLGGTPFKQSLGKSYLNYALGPKLKVDTEAEIKKELLERPQADGTLMRKADTPENIAQGQEYVQGLRGKYQANLPGGTARTGPEIYKRMQKDRMKKMENLYPTTSIKEIDDRLAENNMTIEDVGGDYGAVQDFIKQQSQSQSIADAGGVANMASGGLANLTRTIPPEKGPQSQGLASFMKNGKR